MACEFPLSRSLGGPEWEVADGGYSETGLTVDATRYPIGTGGEEGVRMRLRGGACGEEEEEGRAGAKVYNCKTGQPRI